MDIFGGRVPRAFTTLNAAFAVLLCRVRGGALTKVAFSANTTIRTAFIGTQPNGTVQTRDLAGQGLHFASSARDTAGCTSSRYKRAGSARRAKSVACDCLAEADFTRSALAVAAGEEAERATTLTCVPPSKHVPAMRRIARATVSIRRAVR